MKKTTQTLMQPAAPRRPWAPVHIAATCASAALLFGSISLSMVQLAVPGAATAAPVGQPEGSAPYYFSVPNYANSPLYDPADLVNFPGIRKFVDTLPGLGAGAANTLGQYIPVAVPDTITYPGSDYYEIGIVEYEEKMHSDLPATKLRGYVQLATSVVPGAATLTNPGPDGDPTTADGTAIKLPDGSPAIGVDKAHYLGPLISATKDRPVRILFRNLLPTGAAGDLFVPVDTSVLGSGAGPLLTTADPNPQLPQCGASPKPAGCYAENRATLHLHGGLSPWISDGTPHQWVVPAGETTSYTKGVSVKNVPDMPDPGPGAITFFYTNQQSARLMFYHDHAWGMTRLNVYVGGAAGYAISDDTEKALITAGIIPADTLPLIIQDKTFVPSDAQLIPTDPLWDKVRWGDFGDLWAPHVYVPAQNPGDSSGVNQYGRWAYGPWFWPPTNNITFPPVANAYYDPACDPNIPNNWCEPPLMPGTPFNSMGMESFHDTPVVNGTAYPTVTVEPKAYRFRVLNAANDRFFNLSLYKADPLAPTEVQLNPAEVAAALLDPTIFPTPVVGTEGPSWIQFGNEGGFLPAPVVIPPQPTTWVTDPTVFNAGNVDKHSLLLGPAERAEVIVDFSQFAGQTLILYNDAPAAFPARDPRYDYYTGNGDYRATGGAPPTIAGYGPNTRTVMQIKVEGTPAAVYDIAPLQQAFAANAGGTGVFQSSQNPIIVGQGAYNSAYGTTFQDNGPKDGLVRIYDNIFNFSTLSGTDLTIPLLPKAIQDEMGEAFDPEYGRMSGNLGLEAPGAAAGVQILILYPFVNPASEIVMPINLPPGVSLTPITSADDGTQIWKITHNGVDTHPIHFHLFDVQLINRVGWDGIIRKPDLNELGWKETVRISPLEDTIVALRPVLPKLPFGLPDSIRPLNPAMPIGSTELFNNIDAFGNPMTVPITNQMTNFEWEYVWHCHILSHEEMDMMRPVVAQVNPELAYPPMVTLTPNGTGGMTLNWTDNTLITYDPTVTPSANIASWGSLANEIGFKIDRAVVANNGKVGAFTTIGTVLANVTTFNDTTAVSGTNYRYRVVAYNAAGDTNSATFGALGVTSPLAPTNAAAVMQAGPRINVTWRDNANNEDFFLLERSVDGGAYVLIAQVPAKNNTGNVSYVDTMVGSNHSYQYRVAAVNAATSLPPASFAMSNLVQPVAVPIAPSNLTGSAVLKAKKADITLNWVDNSADETGFTIERATNNTFTVGLNSSTVGANTTTVTQTGLARGVTYFFRVQASNKGGSSAWSNVITVVAP